MHQQNLQYRPNRETWENAGFFVCDVYEGFNSRFEISAAAIDLEDAYNRDPLDVLMGHLLELKSIPFLLNCICAVLYQWKAVFKLDLGTINYRALIPGYLQRVHSQDHGRADLSTWKDTVIC